MSEAERRVGWTGPERRNGYGVDEFARERAQAALERIEEHEKNCAQRWLLAVKLLGVLALAAVGSLVTALVYVLTHPAITLVRGPL